MINTYWKEQEQKFFNAIKDVDIPNSNLDNVDNIIVSNKSDLNVIPEGGGCYWIWTNEPVKHSLHKNELPIKVNNGEIIYNGIAKDDVKSRIEHHLFGDIEAGWSGISLDIYPKESTSHRKKALSPSPGKVPYIKVCKKVKRGNKSKGIKKGDDIQVLVPIRKKDDLLTLNLSQTEIDYINNTNYSKYYFRNGINIREGKHNSFQFRVYFITGLSTLYLEYVEKRWRESGLPKLCSYKSGR